MYLDFFGLKKEPFKITPDPALFYSGGKRGDILDAIVYSITSGAGITKVVGEVGSGKTMLCRMLQNKLPSSIHIAYIANPSLSPENILPIIAMELGIKLDTNSKIEAMHQLHTWLLEQHAQNKQVVIFVEEAQYMPTETLEEIRLLSNLETNEDKLLQIVLFGQPELDDNLARQEIRQLKDRITNSFELGDFSASEISHYIEHRLNMVGYRGPNIFNAGAIKLISKYSKGLIRRVNILADKAMLAAFSNEQHIIKAKHVNLAALDSQFKSKGSMSIVSIALLSTLFSSLLFGATAFAYFKYNKSLTDKPISNIQAAIVNPKNSTPSTPKTTQLKPKKETAQLLPSTQVEKTTYIVVPEDLETQNTSKPQKWLIEKNSNYTIQVLLGNTELATIEEEVLSQAKKRLNLGETVIYQSKNNNIDTKQ